MSPIALLVNPSEQFLSAARGESFDVVVVDDHPRQDLPLDSGCSFYQTTFEPANLFAFASSVAAALNPAVIVGISEKGVRPAAFLREAIALKTGTASSAVATTQDKAAFRRALDVGGFGSMSLRWWTPDPAFESPHGNPSTWKGVEQLIIKPRTGTASQNIRSVPIDEFPSMLVDASDIVEEYIEGPEFSVEGFSTGVEYAVLGVTAKVTDPDAHVELGHVVPGTLIGTSQTEVESALGEVLGYLGAFNTPSHTEIRLAGNRIVLIETHCRVGGDGISQLLRHATGFDLLRSAILVQVGASVVRDSPKYTSAAISFVTAPVGKVTDLHIPGDHPLATSQGIDILEVTPFVAVGDFVRPLASSSDRAGCAIAASAHVDPDRVLAAASQAARSLRISVDARFHA